MKTKSLIPSLLVATGLLATPWVHAQPTNQMPGDVPGQTAPMGPRPMPSPGQQGGTPSTATPMPPATGGGAYGRPTRPGGPGGPGGSGMQGGPGMQGDPGMSQQRPPGPPPAMSGGGRPPQPPMGAQSPYAPQKWSKGDKLPTEFRDRQYVIDNYKQYDLPAPRKGHHWVGVGADYYQVSSNGTIFSVGPQ
ncbi:RcnB family protein [Cupriavidus plantarum]|uniref:Nickel/cobalt transporter regulator n=1 Tax=Cupriavidus plantarum TaxID=942865 RepID=A0A316EYU9_9BURK|nr:RcnB family protein [Cupriavidus plantarum]PWK37561.1 nickel/cobalt transporter regulator [Cupriavidus plantarum]